MTRQYRAGGAPRSTRSGTLCGVLSPTPRARQIPVGDAIRSLRCRRSRFWPQRRQIVRCNMGIAMALPREMRPGAHVLNGGAVAYNDDAELVAALHRGDRAART